MSVLITGSTGFIGINLAHHLAENGTIVHALYRSEIKAEALKHKNIKLFKGDILNKESLHKAMTGCSEVYHVAAFTDVWTKDPAIIYDLNVNGTINVFEVASDLKIKNIVFTSTAGVLGPSVNNVVNENSPRTVDYFIDYERTKAIAEEKAQEYVIKGLNIRIVNPTRVYGPGLLSKSNSVTRMIKSYSEGKWRIIPGNGKSIGNYVFISDVIKGHTLAMKNGQAGQRYILGGENVSYVQFFNTLQNAGTKKFIMLKLPFKLMMGIAYSAMLISRIIGVKPFITPALVRKFNYNWELSSEKAVLNLEYKITSLENGMKETLNWIQNSKTE